MKLFKKNKQQTVLYCDWPIRLRLTLCFFVLYVSWALDRSVYICFAVLSRCTFRKQVCLFEEMSLTCVQYRRALDARRLFITRSYLEPFAHRDSSR